MKLKGGGDELKASILHGSHDEEVITPYDVSLDVLNLHYYRGKIVLESMQESLPFPISSNKSAEVSNLGGAVLIQHVTILIL